MRERSRNERKKPKTENCDREKIKNKKLINSETEKEKSNAETCWIICSNYPGNFMTIICQIQKNLQKFTPNIIAKIYTPYHGAGLIHHSFSILSFQDQFGRSLFWYNRLSIIPTSSGLWHPAMSTLALCVKLSFGFIYQLLKSRRPELEQKKVINVDTIRQ